MSVATRTPGSPVQTPTRSWETVRRLVLDRDNYCCVSCGHKCAAHECDVHHVVPRSIGGSDEPSNLVTLCDGCHGAVHPNLQVGLARRFIERWGVRLACWLDRNSEVPHEVEAFGPVLRLLGLKHFRDGQLEIVREALQGKSVLVVAPTGSGKSLCFQLPAVLKRGLTLVITPTKALMSDQVSALQRKKLPASYVNGDLGTQERAERYKLLQKGALKFLYCAPERFDVRDRDEVAKLRQLRPDYLVVDEAHCVDKWGNDFRPDYGTLAEIRKSIGSPPVLAFTASAGIKTQRRVLQSLGVEDATVFVRDVDRPNIAMFRRRMAREDRASEIYRLVTLPNAGRTMIFVPTVKIGDALQSELRTLGLEVPFYHSKKGKSSDREILLKQFQGELKPQIQTIICTNAFGMGLNIPDVRMVVHWQQPASVEDYLQEFGRAGRDGKPAVAILYTDTADTGLLRFMAKVTVDSANMADRDAQEALHQRMESIEDMYRMATSATCFRRQVIGYFQNSTKAPTRSWSFQILTWLFSRKEQVRSASVCCDHCAASDVMWTDFVKGVKRVLSGSAK